MNKVSVPLDALERKVHTALINLGLERGEADVVADVLMYSEKRGSSQGLIKIKERTILPDQDCTPIKQTRKTPAIIAIDGGGHTGMYVLNKATTAAASAVANFGIALVTTSNTRSSTGAIGYYARRLARDGYIAIVLAGSPKVMAVSGGIDPVLGTNPIAIAIPTSDNCIVFDTATAAVTWFSVINARDQKQKLSGNVAIDRHGAPTQDPEAAMGGALLAIAGAKGSGLALMFEFLTATLAGASIAGDAADNRGNTIICIDPAKILDDDNFYTRADRLVKAIKSGRPAAGSSGIRMPGEASDARATQCEASNVINIDQELFNEIEKLQSV